MKKKTLAISLSFVTALTAATAVLVGNNSFNMVKGDCNHSGYHYDEVLATTESYGHKEHWTCCECRQVFTTKPSGTFIYICGEYDAGTPEAAHQYESLSNNAEVSVIGGCAHSAARERGDEFNALVDGFSKRITK